MSDWKNTVVGKIPTNWNLVKFNEISTQIVDGTHFTPMYLENGVPFLRVTDIQNTKIDLNNVKRISEKEHQLLNKRCNPVRGDILISKNGTVGIPMLVNWDWKFSIFVSLCLIKLKSNILGEFIKLILGSSIINQQIHRRSKQGTVTNLHLEEIRDFQIPLPPLPQQRKIARILTTIDNLIEKTEALIAKYQSIKQGLMHDLFTRGVDANGKLRLPQSEAPELYKQSELGWIPKEWDETKLGAISKFDSGYAFANHELADHGWKIVRITNLHKVNFPYWKYDGVPKPSWIVKKGNLLFSWAGVASSIDAYLYDGEDALLNQHIYNIRIESLTFQFFVFHWLQFVLPKLRTEIEGGAGQLHLTKSKIEKIAVPMPSEFEMSVLLTKMESIVKQINSGSHQLEKLQQLKTALMQDLLTGKVQVTPDAVDMEPAHE